MAEHHAAFRLLADLARVGVAVGAVAALVGIPSYGIGVPGGVGHRVRPTF